jgi:hypothetical protein
VKLAGAMVDDVRRRVQQETLGHRGRTGDPLYGIRRTLQIGAEHLTEKQAARLDAKLSAGDPRHEVTLAWLPLNDGVGDFTCVVADHIVCSGCRKYATAALEENIAVNNGGAFAPL